MRGLSLDTLLQEEYQAMRRKIIDDIVGLPYKQFKQ